MCAMTPRGTRCSQRDLCSVCGKRAYAMEMLSISGVTFHPECFRCSTCGRKLGNDFRRSEFGFFCQAHYTWTSKAAGGGAAKGNKAVTLLESLVSGGAGASETVAGTCSRTGARKEFAVGGGHPAEDSRVVTQMVPRAAVEVALRPEARMGEEVADVLERPLPGGGLTGDTSRLGLSEVVGAGAGVEADGVEADAPQQLINAPPVAPSDCHHTESILVHAAFASLGPGHAPYSSKIHMWERPCGESLACSGTVLWGGLCAMD